MLKYLVGVFCLMFVGCKDEQVTQYTIPKETRHVAVAKESGNASSDLAVQTESFAQPFWEAPAHWEVKPLGQLRKGSFSVKGEDEGEVDISVLVFPGNVGGTLANVNRWAEQAGLPAFQSLPHLKRMGIDGYEGMIVDLHGQYQSIYGVIIEMPTCSWYFKMIGPDKMIEAEKANFQAFLGSVRFN